MRSLAGISLRTLRRSTRRYVLTGLGASLGVAALFAVLVTSVASREALSEAIRGQTGRADVIIRPSGAFDSVLPAGAADGVRALPDVDTVVEGVGFRSAVQPPGTWARPASHDHILFVRGLGDDFGLLNDLALDTGRMVSPGAAEVLIPKRLAEYLELGLDSPVVFATPAGTATATITGIVADTGAGTANQGDVLYTSVEAAESFSGTEGPSSLQVDLAPGVAAASWIDQHRGALSGLAVQDAADIDAGFRSFIDSVNGSLTIIAAIAVFIGGFLVYLTFSVAVAERTKVLGTLRALGASRRRVQRVVVIEAIVLGALCSMIGLAIGLALASISVGLVGRLLDLDLDRPGAPVFNAVFSFAIGVVVATAAAWVPARRASHIDPVSAMRSGALAIERPTRRWLGPVLLLVGGLLGLSSSSVTVGGIGMLTVLAGAVLSVQQAIGPIAPLVGRVTARLSSGTGAIAVRHLRHERSRSSFTLALVMVALATIVSVAATNQAMRASLDQILDEQASAIQVFAPGVVDDGVAEQIAGVDGAATISAVRVGEADLATADGGTTSASAFIQIIDPATYFDVAGLPYTSGDDKTVVPALADGGAVVLPSIEANRLGAEVGDVVQITTSAGPAPFDVVGVYAVIGGGFGAVVGEADLDRFGSGRVNGFLVGTDGTDPEVVAGRIRDTVGVDRQLIIDSPQDTRDFANETLAGFFGLAYAILVVAVVISMLGLANTLVVTVLDRTREIGLLRSTGARRRQVAAMVTVEAITMAAVAFVIALPLGGFLTFGILDLQRETLGAGLSYAYPWAWVLPLVGLTLLVSALASAVPARRASRLQIVDTLRFE